MTFPLEYYLGWFVGYVVFRELLSMYSTHKLLNKLMSRNYGEYQLSSKAPGPNQKPGPEDFEAHEDIVL